MWTGRNKSCSHICSAWPYVWPRHCSFFIYFLRFHVGHWGSLLKNSHTLTMSVQLAAFNFIPAKFQSRPSPRPLTLGARTSNPLSTPTSFSLFRITGGDCTCVLLFSTLVDRGLGMYSGNTSKKSKKAAIFCLNISLTKSIDHPWVSWERGSEMERHVLFSNNSYLHPFLPLCCGVVVGRTSALFLGELLRLKLFYASAPRAPIWKVLCVSFHTLLSYGKERRGVLPFTLFCDGVLCGGGLILHLVTNGSRKDDKFICFKESWNFCFVALFVALYVRSWFPQLKESSHWGTVVVYALPKLQYTMGMGPFH